MENLRDHKPEKFLLDLIFHYIQLLASSTSPGLYSHQALHRQIFLEYDYWIFKKRLCASIHMKILDKNQRMEERASGMDLSGSSN